MTSDGRTRSRLQEIGADIDDLEKQERRALRFLTQYDKEEVSVSEVLDAILEYDSCLARSSETSSMRAKYKRTLMDRPWRNCNCNFCQKSRDTHADLSWCQ